MTKILVTVLFFLTIAGYTSAQSPQQQEQLPEDPRIEEIRNNLEALSRNKVPGLLDTVNFGISGASLQEVIRSLATTNSLNVNIRNLPQVTLTNSFTNVTAKDLLLFLVTEYDLDIKFVNNIMSISAMKQEKPIPIPGDPDITVNNGLVTADLRGDSIYVFIRKFATLTGANLTVTPDLAGTRLNGYVKDLDTERALEQIAFANNLEFDKVADNVFSFSPSSVATQPGQSPPAGNAANNNRQNGRNNQNQNYNNTGRNAGNAPTVRRNASGRFRADVLDIKTQTFTLDAEGADIADLIVHISDKLKVDYVLLTPPVGYFDGYLGRITYRQFLDLVLPRANSGYAINKDVFIIGGSQDNGTVVSEVYRVQNRSVDSLEVLLPKVLLDQVTLQPYPGINAFIISGDQISVSRVVSFLQQIDKTIPNILIEVIVADIRKGYSIRTGITAGLADSAVSTTGTIFPGIDLTLGSGSVNNFLQNLDSKGVINLGRVTPQFYATLQALEDNDFLDTRSTPKLSTLNGRAANLKIGEKVFYLIENQNVAPGVNPIITNAQRYENAEANLEITIRPFVSGNEDITLDIDAEFSDFLEPSVIGGPPGTATRQFKSKIRVRNEEMIILGGLEETSKSENGTGVPLLGRLPILKWLFSSKAKTKRESRLVVFIKPTVIY